MKNNNFFGKIILTICLFLYANSAFSTPHIVDQWLFAELAGKEDARFGYFKDCDMAKGTSACGSLINNENPGEFYFVDNSSVSWRIVGDYLTISGQYLGVIDLQRDSKKILRTKLSLKSNKFSYVLKYKNGYIEGVPPFRMIGVCDALYNRAGFDESIDLNFLGQISSKNYCSFFYKSEVNPLEPSPDFQNKVDSWIYSELTQYFPQYSVNKDFSDCFPVVLSMYCDKTTSLKIFNIIDDSSIRWTIDEKFLHLKALTVGTLELSGDYSSFFDKPVVFTINRKNIPLNISIPYDHYNLVKQPIPNIGICSLILNLTEFIHIINNDYSLTPDKKKLKKESIEKLVSSLNEIASGVVCSKSR